MFALPGCLNCANIASHLGLSQREHLKEFRKEIFHRDYMCRMVAFAQARELLLHVRRSSIKTALATSSDREDLATCGKLVGMDDLVDEASSRANAKTSKPEPDIFAAALNKVNMRLEQAVALGDTPWDAEAAGKLGMPVIGLTSGGWKADDLRCRLRGSVARPGQPSAPLR